MSWDGKERRMQQNDRDLLVTINANLLIHLERQKDHEVEDNRRFSLFEEKIDTIYKNIVGNGDIGLKTRVVLLEDSEKSRKESNGRLWSAVTTTFIALLGKIGWDLLKK